MSPSMKFTPVVMWYRENKTRVEYPVIWQRKLAGEGKLPQAMELMEAQLGMLLAGVTTLTVLVDQDGTL